MSNLSLCALSCCPQPLCTQLLCYEQCAEGESYEGPAYMMKEKSAFTESSAINNETLLDTLRKLRFNPSHRDSARQHALPKTEAVTEHDRLGVLCGNNGPMAQPASRKTRESSHNPRSRTSRNNCGECGARSGVNGGCCEVCGHDVLDKQDLTFAFSALKIRYLIFVNRYGNLCSNFEYE